MKKLLFAVGIALIIAGLVVIFNPRLVGYWVFSERANYSGETMLVVGGFLAASAALSKDRPSH
jgi:uncharacterized membrane protein HdeD (DUF308 family)